MARQKGCLHQYSTGIVEEAEIGDLFGRSLSSDDYNNDGYAELAIGVPQVSVFSVPFAGAVNVLYGEKKVISLQGILLLLDD